MALIKLISVDVLHNPACFRDDFEFAVTFDVRLANAGLSRQEMLQLTAQNMIVACRNRMVIGICWLSE